VSGGTGAAPTATAVRARAPAKINLALHVGPRRADGYHDVATVYQAIDLYDEVLAETRADGLVSVQTSDLNGNPVAGVADDRTHLAVRAAHALRTRAGVGAGVHLRVRKQIPVAGGMAGGSADAAAALVACARLWGLPNEPAGLAELAAGLGSDVPFALLGGTALGTGRGERVAALPTGPPATWVLVTSSSGLSTPSVYAETDRYRAEHTVPAPQVDERLLRALSAGDLRLVAGSMRNELQDAAQVLRPELTDLIAAGSWAGALAGLVTGSGPSVALLVDDDVRATTVAAAVGPVARRLLPGAQVRTAHGPAPGAHLVGTPEPAANEITPRP